MYKMEEETEHGKRVVRGSAELVVSLQGSLLKVN
jgi:hypothetical protein